MQTEIELSSSTALQVIIPLGLLLRSNDIPKKDKDNIFKMIEGIKQFINKKDFDEYVKTMKYFEQHKDVIQDAAKILKVKI